jgi:hypothetical protein
VTGDFRLASLGEEQGRQDFEQCGLPSAVVAEYSADVPLIEAERDVNQGGNRDASPAPYQKGAGQRVDANSRQRRIPPVSDFIPLAPWVNLPM